MSFEPSAASLGSPSKRSCASRMAATRLLRRQSACRGLNNASSDSEARVMSRMNAWISKLLAYKRIREMRHRVASDPNSDREPKAIKFSAHAVHRRAEDGGDGRLFGSQNLGVDLDEGADKPHHALGQHAVGKSSVGPPEAERLDMPRARHVLMSRRRPPVLRAVQREHHALHLGAAKDLYLPSSAVRRPYVRDARGPPTQNCRLAAVQADAGGLEHHQKKREHHREKVKDAPRRQADVVREDKAAQISPRTQRKQAPNNGVIG